MTAQIAENLRHKSEDLAMCTTPLSDYFTLGGLHSPFESNCTALWRGYIGSWEIVDDRLYLISLRGTLKDGVEASLETVFPEYPNRVFAHWYSGTIRIPQGKELRYVHMGFGSTYERDLLLQLESGVVVATRVKHYGLAETDGTSNGYEVGALTVFPTSKRVLNSEGKK